ncbi:hypothetical protein BD309DRAFT_1013863 [Dichomitus squalens]|nr:hypothetical protein BD309DRAFT_1013863 [Dichomitus squalens]
MSSVAPVAYIVTLADSIRAYNNLLMVVLTVLFYDYSLTIAREIEYFWKRARFSLAALLFVINRYLSLFGNIVVVLEYFMYHSPQIQAYHAYFTVASQVVVGLLLVIRTYALYNGSKALLATFCAFGIVMFAATLVAMTVMVPPEPPAKILPQALGCDLSVSLPVAILGWIAMVCFDTMIFVLTVAKAFRMAPFWHHRLLSILFRDGAVYYIIMGLVNSGNLLTLVLPSIGDTNRGFLTSLTNAICTAITSRMLLNLRDPELQGGTLRVGRWSISRTSQVAGAGSTASSEAKTAQAAASDCGPVCNHTTILVEPQPTGRVEV